MDMYKHLSLQLPGQGQGGTGASSQHTIVKKEGRRDAPQSTR